MNRTGTTVIWVLLPSLNSSSSAYIWLYYDNPSASPAANPNIWTTAGYYGVYHGPMSSSQLKDYSAIANNATFEGSASPVSPGAVGTGFTCSAKNAYNLPAVNDWTSVQSFFAWVNVYSSPCSHGSSKYPGFLFSFANTNSIRLGVAIDYNCGSLYFYTPSNGFFCQTTVNFACKLSIPLFSPFLFLNLYPNIKYNINRCKYLVSCCCDLEYWVFSKKKNFRVSKSDKHKEKKNNNRNTGIIYLDGAPIGTCTMPSSLSGSTDSSGIGYVTGVQDVNSFESGAFDEVWNPS